MPFDKYKQRGGIVLRSYARESDAERAVRRLRNAGFGPDDISIVAKDKGRAEDVARDTGTDTAEEAGIGAATGGVLGAIGGLLLGATSLTIPGIGIVIAGPLAAVLGGAGIGAITGGLAGALAGLGMSEENAKQYQQRVEAGDILVVVAAGEREPQAGHILEGATYEPQHREEIGYVREGRAGEGIAVEGERAEYRTTEDGDITARPRTDTWGATRPQ